MKHLAGTAMNTVFHPELWGTHDEDLVQGDSGLKNLKLVLAGSTLSLAETLRLGLDRHWTPEEMQQLEHLILGSINGASFLKPVFDALGLAVKRHRLYTTFASPLPRSMQQIRLESNPFRENLPQAEQCVKQLRHMVAGLSSTIKFGHAEASTAPQSLLALACLSAVAHLQLLDRALLIALLEAMADRKAHLIASGSSVGVIILSVAWGNQAQAERRMYIPDRLTNALLAMVNEDEVRQVLASVKSGTGDLKTSHDMLYRLLQNSADDLLKTVNAQDHALNFRSALRAARTVAYLEVPGAAIAAFRARKSISHAPSVTALRRLFFGGLELVETGILSDDVIRPAIQDARDIEPTWLIGMRNAFRNKSRKQLIADLSKTALNHGVPGPCLAGFALRLLQQRKMSPASTKRFSLLIATRLGSRISDLDPGALDIYQLEELYAKVLDDDHDSASGGTGDQDLLQSKRTTVKALSLFHHYLQLVSPVGPLKALKDRLHIQGLLPVDANFITIDEYRLVLTFLTREKTLSNPHLRTALRLLVTLCFWLGLRRNEALFLRVSDLDAAGHLHIRPYARRKLKTQNSSRSLPAAILLPKEDFAELEQWVGKRATASKTGVEALLFSTQNDASRVLDPDYVFTKIANSMREALRDPSLKLHHLRHSFATLLAARLLPQTQGFASTFLKLHPLTVEWLTNEKARKSFRALLFGTDQVHRADLQAIAHMLGHSSPATTVEHYVHCLDWVGVPTFVSPRRSNAEEERRMMKTTYDQKPASPGTRALLGSALWQRNLFCEPDASPHFPLKKKRQNLAWLFDTGKLLVRHFDYGDSLERCSTDLDIPLDLVVARVGETKLLSTLPVALKFKLGRVLGIKYPADLVHVSSTRMAEQIAIALQKLVRRDPGLVGRAVDTYIRNVQESNHLVLTKRDWLRADAEAGSRVTGFRDLIRLVSSLGVPELTVQFIGYTVAGALPNLRTKLQLLGAKRGTAVHLTKSRNQNSNAALDHLGIRFGSVLQKDGTTQVNSSDAFKYVMAIAAICKVWQQPARQNGFGVEEAYRNQILPVAVNKPLEPKDQSEDAVKMETFVEQIAPHSPQSSKSDPDQMNMLFQIA